MSLCYREGLRLGKVKANVARLVRQRKESRGRKRFLSREEYAALYAEISDLDHLEEFYVSVHAGMRLTEQFTAAWDQFHPERREIHLTKTKNGEDRTVTLTSDVCELLLRHRERMQPGNKKLRPRAAIFPRAGETCDTRSWFKPALERAGIEGYVWHSNRHTFCSWLAIAGVPLKTIQDLAGHKTISITAQYAHLCPDHNRREVEKITRAPKPRRQRAPAAPPLRKTA